MKVFAILLILIAAASAEKSFITFQNSECEAKASNLQGKLFGANSKFLKNIGVMIVDLSSHKLLNALLLDQEFSSCVKKISENEKIYVSPLHSAAGEKEKHWQLKRINVSSLPLPDSFKRFEKKATSHVYVIDSGIDGGHPDFAGRLAPAEQHTSFVDYDRCCKEQGPLCDCAEHGTHCAGLIASPEAGYNLNTTLHSAKVFDQSGSTTYETILNAMEWVITAHKKFNPTELGVVSMSLGGGYSDAINQGANRIVESGLFLAVAAGNSNKDSCTGSPSSAEKAFTVGASDINDNRAYFSEFGKCVDIFAPGLDIWSCKPGGSYQFLSGTSMATPFVAGFASYVGTYLETTDPDVIAKAINDHSSKHKVKNSKSANDNLPFDNLVELDAQLEIIKNSLKLLLKKD